MALPVSFSAICWRRNSHRETFTFIESTLPLDAVQSTGCNYPRHHPGCRTDEPLPGVNVIIKGTYYGAASASDGKYIITGISPGSYDIEISMVGYKVLLKTGVEVKAEAVVTENFDLEQTVLALGEEVVVMGKKPLFDVDETASLTRISSDDIQNKIVNSVEDILSEQIGVTTVDNEIHIRGGRIDESLFIIDGLSIKDPLSGYGGNLFINAESIENMEIITGGYNAEYGQAMSGVVNIRLKEGRDNYEGSVKYASDNWGFSQNSIIHYNTDHIELNLGGPSTLFELLPKTIGLDLPGRFFLLRQRLRQRVGYSSAYRKKCLSSPKLVAAWIEQYRS